MKSKTHISVVFSRILLTLLQLTVPVTMVQCPLLHGKRISNTGEEGEPQLL